MPTTAGQATSEWLITVALVVLLGVIGHRMLFPPLRGAYRAIADCVSVGACDAFER